MPVLKKPIENVTITLPPRAATVAADCQVLVVGGGPAGIGAAVGAAKAGANVILVERYGFLGGNATASLVMPLMSFHTARPNLERAGATNLLPNDHGPGHPIIAGVVQELLERLVRARGAIAPTLDTGYVVPFDPEVFKSVALDMLDAAGVRYLLHAFASDVVGDGCLDGVVFESKSGPIVIKADCVVDCTGDGDVAARAGAEFELGREADGLVQPMSMMFRIVDFHRQIFDAYIERNPDQWHGVHGLWDLVKQASEAGELDLAREDILFFATPHSREVSVNSTRINRVLSTDVWDLSYAEWEGRRQMRQIARFLHDYVPGFEQSYCAQSGANIGVRESRRVLGEYRLTADDLLAARKFPDAIARGSYPVDIHNPSGKGTILQRLPPDDAYDIPLRALLPQRVDRLVMAGRPISGSHEAHSSYRVMPICMATGQAAGVCAALAALNRTMPRAVDPREVRRELRGQGANLG